LKEEKGHTGQQRQKQSGTQTQSKIPTSRNPDYERKNWHLITWNNHEILEIM